MPGIYVEDHWINSHLRGRWSARNVYVTRSKPALGEKHQAYKRHNILVIINKYNGKSDLEDFCIKKNFKIIGRIPFMKNIAEGYSKGNFLYKIPEMEAELQKISLEILK